MLLAKRRSIRKRDRSCPSDHGGDGRDNGEDSQDNGKDHSGAGGDHGDERVIGTLLFTEAEWAALLRTFDLSPRQAIILRLVVCGMKDARIAHELGIKQSTARVHLGRILRRLNVKSRLELVIVTFLRFRQLSPR
jgi:DNA-binding CsgD family transcriptional regulator